MKFLAILFFSLVTFNLAHAETEPAREVAIGIGDVFVPGGFDSESDAYVVVSGMFPNSCYRWKEAEVDHLSEFEHEITPMATVTQGMCLMVLVPFTKDVQLGKLDSGKHTLRFVSGDGTYLERKLVVE